MKAKLQTEKKSKTFTISLPSAYYEKLEDMSKKNERSKNFFVKKAIENYLEDLYLYQKAEEALSKGVGKGFTLEEIKAKYGL